MRAETLHVSNPMIGLEKASSPARKCPDVGRSRASRREARHPNRRDWIWARDAARTIARSRALVFASPRLRKLERKGRDSRIPDRSQYEHSGARQTMRGRGKTLGQEPGQSAQPPFRRRSPDPSAAQTDAGTTTYRLDPTALRQVHILLASSRECARIEKSRRPSQRGR